MRALLLALCLAGVAAGAQAATVTANFEGITGTFVLPPSVVSQGFNFATSGNNLGVIANGGVCGPVCADNGTSTLIFGIPTGGINPPSIPPLVITGPGNFHLLGFDYAELQPTGSPVNATFLRVIGHQAGGGGNLMRTIFLDGINDGIGGAADFQTSAFDAAFQSAVFDSVMITGRVNADLLGGFGADNFVFDTIPVVAVDGGVPEPASWALMIGGFALAGAALRRRPKVALA